VTGTILVVEDNRPILDMMEILLSRMGYTSVLVNDALEAGEAVKRELPHLILLDVMMKPVSGWEFLKELRASDKTREIPVIIFTACPAADDKIAKLCDPHVSILYKPVNIDELRDALEKSLAGS
jgi:DNA-binding response OmpR family regulator